MKDKYELMQGAFFVIVDTGCTNSVTPFQEDFEKYVKLDKPICLDGIGGNTFVTHGGILKYECISSTGNIVTIRIFGFHNPAQKVRLFGPHLFQIKQKPCWLLQNLLG